MRLPTPFEMAVPNPDLEMRQLSYRPFPRRLHPFRLSPQSLVPPVRTEPVQTPSVHISTPEADVGGESFRGAEPVFPTSPKEEEKDGRGMSSVFGEERKETPPAPAERTRPRIFRYFFALQPQHLRQRGRGGRSSARDAFGRKRGLWPYLRAWKFRRFWPLGQKRRGFLPLTTARERRRNARSAARGIFLTTRTIRKILTVCVPIFRNSAAECLRKAIRPERTTYRSVVLRCMDSPRIEDSA